MYNLIKQNSSVKHYNTFKIGGNAHKITVVYSVEGLQEAVSTEKNFILLGKGSNVLFSDSALVQPLIINCADQIAVLKEDDEQVELSVASGMGLARLCLFCKQNGYSGLEWAYGIPGTVGGATVMNAGAFGGEMKDSTISVSVISNNEVFSVPSSECAWGYRNSRFKLCNEVVAAVSLRLKKADEKEIAEKMSGFLRQRKLTQPSGYSAGSIFKAVDGVPAAKYIEEAGLKGFCVGEAMVSNKHANFIINGGYALAADVVQLIITIKAIVFEKFGVKLQEEIVYLGDF